MSFIIFITSIIKSLFYFLLSDSIALRIFYCVLIFILQKSLRKHLNLPKNVSLFTYKIKYIIIPIFCVIMYFSIFILLLTVYRISNIHKIIDLKRNFLDLYVYISSADKLILVTNIILLIFILRFLFLLYTQIKVSSIIQFTKLYIYLYQYSSFRNALFYIIHHILDTFSLCIFVSNKSNIKFNYCRYFVEHFGIFIILICLFYDVVFNSMLISHVFYIIPFAYLYTQVFVFKNFVQCRHIINDVSLAKFYYIKHIHEDQDGVYLENGDFYSPEDIQNLQEHILQDFKI